MTLVWGLFYTYAQYGGLSYHFALKPHVKVVYMLDIAGKGMGEVLLTYLPYNKNLSLEVTFKNTFTV